MSTLAPAIATETRKAVTSRVLRWTTGLLLAAVLALVTGILMARNLDDPQLTAKLGPLAEIEGWPALLGVAAQITAAGVMPALGIGLSRLIGREFVEGTITGLFALPVPRRGIALAKLIVYAVWVLAVAIILTSALLLLGLVLGYGVPGVDEWRTLARHIPLTVLVGLTAMPAAWAATLGLLVIAQVMAFTGVGAWFPLVTPALWAIDPAAVSGAQLALVPSTPLVFGALTLITWHRLQLDR